MTASANYMAFACTCGDPKFDRCWKCNPPPQPTVTYWSPERAAIDKLYAYGGEKWRVMPPEALADYLIELLEDCTNE